MPFTGIYFIATVIIVCVGMLVMKRMRLPKKTTDFIMTLVGAIIFAGAFIYAWFFGFDEGKISATVLVIAWIPVCIGSYVRMKKAG